MANITITIPQNKLQLVIDAYCDTFNYQSTVDDGRGNQVPNPVTKAEFSKSILMQNIKDVVKSYKIRTDSNAVINNANTESDGLGLG